jgi:hypothetical protein
MLPGRFPKQYGRHNYPTLDPASFLDSKVECSYGCGCSLDCGRECGPAGIDPRGTCPKNPVDGRPLGGELDHRYVVEQRIYWAEARAEEAERKYHAVKPGERALVRELKLATRRLRKSNEALEEIRHLLPRKNRSNQL